MSFKFSGVIEDRLIGNVFFSDQRAQLDTGNDRGGAAAEATGERYFVMRGKLDAWQRNTFAVRGERHRTIDQIHSVARERFVFFRAGSGDTTRFGSVGDGGGVDGQVEFQRKAEAIKARAEIGR